MKKAIIFDLDGTLLDTSEGVKKAILFVIKKMRLGLLTDEEMQEFIGPPIYESLKKKYDLDETETIEATELFRCVYKEKYLYEAVTYAGIEDVLIYLKQRGYLLGVATNKRYDYVSPLLEKFDLLKYFDCVQGTDFENTLKKPDVIRNCMEVLRLKIGDYACMIGDTMQDYEGAKAVGIDFLGVTYGFGITKNTSEISVVNNVSDIIKKFI